MPNPHSRGDRQNVPPGLGAIGIFLLFGAVMAGLAGITLAWRDTVRARIWALNPRAWAELVPHAAVVGPLFAGLSAALAGAGIGWLRRRLWAWRLGVALIAIQVIGDLVNVARGDFLRGITGGVIAGALLFYMLRPAVRAQFAGHDPPHA